MAATAQGSIHQGGSNEFTVQQIEQLLRSLPNTQTKPTSFDDEMKQNFVRFAGMASLSSEHSADVEWIIDSGASDHMTCDNKCVENIKMEKEGIKINLLNGECSKITKYSTVRLKMA